MKRFLLSIVAAAAVAGSAQASFLSLNQTMANEVVTSTKNYTLDMSANTVDLLSAQIDVSSNSPSAITFNDGTPSTGSLTVTSTSSLAGAQATDTLTINTNSALIPAAGTDTITVSSNGVTALSGASITLTAEGNTFVFTQGVNWLVGASSQTTASSIASAINGVRYWTASAALGVITVTCANTGSACNSYTLAKSTVALSIGGANFTGGQDNSSFQINGQQYIQGIDWNQASLSSNTAVNIANAINSLDTQGVTASTTSSNVVTIKAVNYGTAANSFTLASSTQAALSAGGANFSGGLAHPFVCVGSLCFTEGTDWSVGASTSATASNINTAVNASSNTIGVSGSVSAAKITLTSISPSSTQYRLFSSTTKISTSGGNMTGGVNSAVNVSADTINLPAHGLTTGMAVLYSTGSAAALGGLTNQATYYVISLDKNDIALASSQANALAGTGINITSIPGGRPHNFTVAPLALSGVLTLTLQGSNDGVSYSNVNVSPVTFASPYAASSTLYDLGSINFTFFRIGSSGPDAGGVNLKITVIGKRNTFGQ